MELRPLLACAVLAAAFGTSSCGVPDAIALGVKEAQKRGAAQSPQPQQQPATEGAPAARTAGEAGEAPPSQPPAGAAATVRHERVTVEELPPPGASH